MKEFIVESQTTKLLNKVLLDIRKKLPEIKHNRTAVGTTRTGKTISYSYTDLPRLLEIIDPFFKEYSILFDSMEVGNGYVLLQLKLILEEEIQFSGSIHRIYDIERDFPHQRASALTTARRLFLCGKLGIHPGSDDDGNAAEGNDVSDTLGKHNAGKVNKQLSDEHEKLKLRDHPLFVVSQKIPRSSEEVKEIIEKFRECGIENLVKYDRRKFKNIKLFVENAPLPLLTPSVNAAMNKKLN